MDIIDSVFQLFGNSYDMDKKFLSSTEKEIFNLTLNFLVSYHQNNEANLDKYENILRTCTLIIADYYKHMDQCFLDDFSTIHSFNFLSLYLFVELERKNMLIGLYYITEKSDDIDIVDNIDQTLANCLFSIALDKSYQALQLYINGIILNLCALDSNKIVKKLIDLGLIKFLKKLFNSNNCNHLENAVFILYNIINNSIDEAILVYEAGFLQKIVGYSISEANNKLRKECVNILSITCKYRDLILLSALVDMGVLTAFTHVLRNSNFYEEIECVLLALMCIFDPEARDDEKNIHNHKYIETFINLNGLPYLEKYLYCNNSISKIAESLMNKHFDINEYQCDQESSINYNEFN
jgi:hypothetical protein